ncbi:acyltransferase [Mucilaginibacter sp. L196]|uniref:acyltransferase n=1 Tax=Mucilaginibacter sp. L196 TaxID=1641870 RepID=UPI00131BE7F8|nr:acyltransferase [Mucilaginibacter sp. L196]
MASINYLWKNRARFPFGSRKFCRAWGKRIFSFPDHLIRSIRRNKLIAKGAVISDTAEIGKLRADGHKSKLTIGDFTFIGKVYIALHEQVEIGSKVCINDGVEILTASHDVSDPGWNHIKKKIVIDDYAWIGTGAMLLPGVHIGRGAVVGARAVVAKSVPAYGIVIGNPATLLPKKRVTDIDYNPCGFLASNQAWLVG